MQLAGKTVVVTGASRGIGQAVARALARKGCRLLLTALEQEEVGRLAQELEASGIAVSFHAGDLASDEGMRSFVDWVRSRGDPPDVLVNNAGGGRFGRFASSPWSDIERTLILNALVPTRLIHELLPLLTRRPEAAILNISSAVARLPYPGLAAYGACKGYLSSLSESLACELSGTRVRILCVHPGFTRTHFMSSAGMDMSRVPDWFIRPPEAVAAHVIRILEQDRVWSYGDLATRLGTWLSNLIPHPAKNRIFRNLYWRLPDET
jgi:short-subunit dehydrogenase